MTKYDIYKFLDEQRLGVLGTVPASGRPQSALIGYAVTSELEIVFDTVATSRKYPNLLAQPECSFLVGCADERTVQYEGIAAELRAPDLAHYLELYYKVWPECQCHASWPTIAYFVVRPRWIRYSDYGVRPPVIVEFKFPIRSKRTSSLPNPLSVSSIPARLAERRLGEVCR